MLKLKTDGVLWSKLLDTLYRCAHEATEIHLCTESEPTLEPRLSALLANCKMFNRNAKTVIHSNMHHYDENVWREIIRCNTLDELYVHPDGDAKNVKRLQRLIRRMRWLKPTIVEQNKICLTQNLALSVAAR